MYTSSFSSPVNLAVSSSIEAPTGQVKRKDSTSSVKYKMDELSSINVSTSSVVAPLDTESAISDESCAENHFIPDEIDDHIFDEDVYSKLEEECISEKIHLQQKLIHWALLNKCTHSSIDDLLKILKEHGHPELPSSSRTLLKTPSKVHIIEMGSGQYWYYGIKSNIETVLSNIDKSVTISIIINSDGISPFKSSLFEFWPILFRIRNMPHLKPMVAAVYYGIGKPPLESYLQPFIDELNEVLMSEFDLNGHKINLNINCFVCDTPARCFLKGVVGANSENGACIKCTVEGVWDKGGRHMSYPFFNCRLRTNESFRSGTDEDHHKETTPLSKLPIEVDLVKSFVVSDSLHLFDLGVMRRCLFGWCNGSYNFRKKLSPSEKSMLSSYLENSNNTKPSEINRAIRGLNCLKYWKGSEYRTMLLYLGPVVLKDILPQESYNHFLMLSCAVTILSCHEYLKYIQLAEALLNEYLQRFTELYGIDSVSSNIHNLCHVIDDVKNFGPLPEITSYPFENFLGQMKTLIRSGRKPLHQIAKRIIELSKLNNDDNLSCEWAAISCKDEVGIIHEEPDCKKVYKKICIGEYYILAANAKNKWFLTKQQDIVSMKNATYFKKKLCIYGAAIKSKYNFFTEPFNSSNLNIYSCKEIYDNMKLYNTNEIKCKLFCLKYHDELIFFPLLHTIDVKIKS